MFPASRFSAVALAALAACGHSPPRLRPDDMASLWAVRYQNQDALPDPGAQEVVVVVNYNSPVGNHAGRRAGALLSDPAGSYLALRAWDPTWHGPSLADYVRYQMEDGDRVFIYRFTLSAPAFEIIRQRMLRAGPATSLFCGSAAQHLIAGLGPFAAVPSALWSSPAQLADHLAPLQGHPDAPGICVWPD